MLNRTASLLPLLKVLVSWTPIALSGMCIRVYTTGMVDGDMVKSVKTGLRRYAL